MAEVRCKECKQPMAPGATCHGARRAKRMGPVPRSVFGSWDCGACRPARFAHSVKSYACRMEGHQQTTSALWGENWAAVAWMALVWPCAQVYGRGIKTPATLTELLRSGVHTGGK